MRLRLRDVALLYVASNLFIEVYARLFGGLW